MSPNLGWHALIRSPSQGHTQPRARCPLVTWRQRGSSRLFSKWRIWARDDGEGTDQDHLPMTFWVWPHHLLVHRAADSTTQGLRGPDPVPSSTSATSLPFPGSVSPSVERGQPQVDQGGEDFSAETRLQGSCQPKLACVCTRVHTCACV